MKLIDLYKKYDAKMVHIIGDQHGTWKKWERGDIKLTYMTKEIFDYRYINNQLYVKIYS